MYRDGQELLSLPLLERKAILADTVQESERMAVSRYIEREGIALFNITKEQGLEGIVAKRRDSRYYPGKETKKWIKCKNLLDDDFVICGFIIKLTAMTSLVLGQYDGDVLIYKGHVTLGVSRSDFERIRAA